MGNRERFRENLAHDGCEQTGKAEISEVENPVYSGGKLRPMIESIPDGFERRGRDICCKKCGAVVWTAYD